MRFESSPKTFLSLLSNYLSVPHHHWNKHIKPKDQCTSVMTLAVKGLGPRNSSKLFILEKKSSQVPRQIHKVRIETKSQQALVGTSFSRYRIYPK